MERILPFWVTQSFVISYSSRIAPIHCNNMNDNPTRTLGGLNQLGNHKHSDLNENKWHIDVESGAGEFIGRFNNILANFQTVPQRVLCVSPVDSANETLKRVKVSWNKDIIILCMLHSPCGIHCAYILVISCLTTLSFEKQQYIVFSFLYKDIYNFL